MTLWCVKIVRSVFKNTFAAHALTTVDFVNHRLFRIITTPSSRASTTNTCLMKSRGRMTLRNTRAAPVQSETAAEAAAVVSGNKPPQKHAQTSLPRTRLFSRLCPRHGVPQPRPGVKEACFSRRSPPMRGGRKEMVAGEKKGAWGRRWVVDGGEVEKEGRKGQRGRPLFLGRHVVLPASAPFCTPSRATMPAYGGRLPDTRKEKRGEAN